MTSLWTRLRHRVASVMLAAMMAFVLHGAAVAVVHQHAAGAVGCAFHAEAPAGHTNVAHHHALQDQAPHDHATQASVDPTDLGPHHSHPADGDREGAAEPCCGTMCSAAISSKAPATIGTPLAVVVQPAPAARSPSEDRPEGPERPPRGSDIA